MRSTLYLYVSYPGRLRWHAACGQSADRLESGGIMYVTLGWVLLAGLPLSNPATNDTAVHAPARPPVAAGRVAVWTDRDDPYDRGEPPGST